MSSINKRPGLIYVPTNLVALGLRESIIIVVEKSAVCDLPSRTFESQHDKPSGSQNISNGRHSYSFVSFKDQTTLFSNVLDLISSSVDTNSLTMKNDLRCLLCKMQIHCRFGNIGNMKSHLKSEHDMVKYEVDFILHLCLINRKEREEIIKILGPRLDWFVEKGVIEKDINLFETKESTSELNTEKIFQQAKSKENDVDNTNEVTQEVMPKKDPEVISLEVGDIDKVCNLKKVAKAIEQKHVEFEIHTIMQGKDVLVPIYDDDTIEDTKAKDVEIINLDIADKICKEKDVKEIGQYVSSDMENKTDGEYFKKTGDFENDDLELTLSDEEVDDMEISFKQRNSINEDLEQCKDSPIFLTKDTLEEPMEADLSLSKDESIKNPMETELIFSALLTSRSPRPRSSRTKGSKVEKEEGSEERMVGRVRTRSSVAKEVVVKRTREEKRKEQPRRKVVRRAE